MSRATLGLPGPVRSYLLETTVDEHPALVGLRHATEAQTGDDAEMISSPEQAAYLRWLLRLIGARRCLEIGTFTGYNALSMALTLPEDGTVVACDVSADFPAVGRPFWREAGVASRIDLRIAPATDTLGALVAAGHAGTFDLAFIDADKPGYTTYYEQCLTLLRPGGIIAVDNVLWSGRVADPADQSANTVAIRALNDHVFADARVDAVMLPIGDGLTLATKRT